MKEVSKTSKRVVDVALMSICLTARGDLPDELGKASAKLTGTGQAKLELLQPEDLEMLPVGAEFDVAVEASEIVMSFPAGDTWVATGNKQGGLTVKRVR